ncbi:MAG: LytTR family DNA-binding domain-containing protein [Oceanicaulis sp.]
MGAATSMTNRLRAIGRKRAGLGLDLAAMAAAGAFFAAIGPFDTDTAPPGPRTAYWLTVMLIGGVLVHLAGRALSGRGLPVWARIGLAALAVTPVQTGVVMASGVLIFGYRPNPDIFLELLPAVLVVTLAAVALTELTRRAARPAPPTGSTTAAADTAADTAPGAMRAAPPEIAARLPARLRGAALIALEAEDHYVRVHTEAGSDLVLMRFADAAALADAAHAGRRLHRSWWASAAAIEHVRFARGNGEARLAGGLVAPVSRTYAPALREAGYF